MTSYYILQKNATDLKGIFPLIPAGQTDARNALDAGIATDLATITAKYNDPKYTIEQINTNADNKCIKLTITIISNSYDAEIQSTSSSILSCWTVSQFDNST